MKLLLYTQQVLLKLIFLEKKIKDEGYTIKLKKKSILAAGYIRNIQHTTHCFDKLIIKSGIHMSI